MSFSKVRGRLYREDVERLRKVKEDVLSLLSKETMALSLLGIATQRVEEEDTEDGKEDGAQQEKEDLRVLEEEEEGELPPMTDEEWGAISMDLEAAK